MILRHPDSILVGHSLGAVLIARLLATWRPNLRVRAALLVAPAEPRGNDRVTGPHRVPTGRGSDQQLLPQFDHPVRGQAIKARCVSRISRQRHEQFLLPGRQALLVAGLERAPVQEERR